ncbi:amidohydrolase [Lentzea sp. BCCO 10_0798]|uniref:Amidohydrolase n=1 Tax=Lentzea kristufekii TaxID=3095430 RepID=A0ABU4TWZ5_9PSEU|nr:amidohydrolase [Lentzea sp. BCCO 10_0798]MDX8052834.1 amidohydrolase [Lentzea sp. BCCO 10_0798]
MKLDLKLTGCRAITMDPARPAAHTIGIWQGRIAGLDEQVADLPANETVDLGGAVVLPGFIDAHTHLAWNGRRAIDITGLTTVSQILDRLTDAPGTGWIEASGYDRRIMDRPLTALDLDRISGGRPVYVADLSGHACVVNSVVLKRLPEITSDGWLTENEQLAARTLRLPYSLDEITAELHESARQVLSEGITMCAEAGIGAGLIASSPLEAAAYQRARLPIRVQLMVSAHVLHDVAADPSDGVPRAIDLGLHTGFGDDMLSLGALKLWTDGGMMARTAALSEPYLGTGDSGQLAESEESMRAAIIDGHHAGWQLAIHAIGDRAIDFTLDAVQEAQRQRPRPDARHRVEHCGLVRPDQLGRIAALGMVPVVQPTFLHSYGDDYSEIMGPRRAPWMYRGRSFLDHGITVAGSSDRPVADGAPLRAIEFMVRRRSSSGRAVGPDEAITVEEAIRAYTLGSAYACRKEHVLGSLTPGKLADLVVLGEDPRTSDAIAEIPVLATAVGGTLMTQRSS